MKKGDIKFFIPMRLDFFNSGGGEKTEKATPKKRKKARDEGQAAKSDEINKALTLIVAFFSFSLFVPYMFANIVDTFAVVFASMERFDNVANPNFIRHLLVTMFMQVIIIGAPLMAIIFALNFFVMLLQVKWNPTMKPLMPKLSKINPISGFKRIFSLKAILELFKSLIKLAVIIFVIYLELSGEMSNLPALMHMPVLTSYIYLGQVAIRLAITIGIWFIFVAALDYAYQKYKHEKDLKMSKHEVKEEWKQMEGNPEVKRKIKQKMREATMRRMMQQMPQADVVITNPTHFAVAIKYDKLTGSAPIVIAKGADHLAKRIKEVAKEHRVTIVENKPLARALYAAVDIGMEIPPDLYKAVAEILAYVYKLKNKV